MTQTTLTLNSFSKTECSLDTLLATIGCLTSIVVDGFFLDDSANQVKVIITLNN